LENSLHSNNPIALFKLTEIQITGNDFSKVDFNSIESLIKSTEVGIKYYGYYYNFQYYKALSNEEKMELAIEKMEEIKNKVSPIIVNDCKIDY